MKLKSEEILPPASRKTASREELLKAYAEFELWVLEALEDPFSEFLIINNKKLRELNEQLRNLNLDLTSDDDKSYDRWSRFTEKITAIRSGMKDLLTDTKIAKFIQEKKDSILEEYVENA